MTVEELVAMFRSAGKRAERIDKGMWSMVVSPDLEGRLYYACQGKVLSRVNPAAIEGHSDRTGYLNPGGDGLWAAPEGTRCGYQYGTGSWRVPAGLVNAHFKILALSVDAITIEAEVDLTNSRQLAVPTLFRRELQVADGEFHQLDSIEYLGARTLEAGEFLLAPWSLCQFDAGANACGRVPAGTALRDYYADSTPFRKAGWDGAIEMHRSAKDRLQIAAGPATAWAELQLPESQLRVHRATAPLAQGAQYIDIADASPDSEPSPEGIRFSIYSDPSGFMELEAVGGCVFPLKTGARLVLDTTTRVSFDGF